MEEQTLPRLVIATDNFIPRRDGITRFLDTVLPHLKQHFQITIICPDFQSNNINMEGIEFLRIPLSDRYIGDFKPAKIRWMAISKQINKADIVFTQTIGPIGAIALYFGYRKHKKTVAFIHSIEWQLVSQSTTNFMFKKLFSIHVKWITRFLYNKCDNLIVPSENIADFLSWEKIITTKKVIHLGVDTKKFIPFYLNEKRPLIRQKYNISPDDVVIGYHGRISPEKDIRTLVRAFAMLRRKYPKLKLMLVGSGIPSLVEIFKSQSGVIHVPNVENVEDYISAMDIYCLPSLTETTSLSTLEAMSCSLPVVTTGVGFIKEYVKDKQNGFIFNKKDSYGLADKLEKLYKNKELRSSFGAASRDVVERDFRWEKTQDELVKFLKQLYEETKLKNKK